MLWYIVVISDDYKDSFAPETKQYVLKKLFEKKDVVKKFSYVDQFNS